MSVDYFERDTPHIKPYDRIYLRIAVAVWTTVVDRQRKITMHLKLRMRRIIWIPRSHHTHLAPATGKPSDIILDSQGHAVEDRWETVVEKAVDGMCFGHAVKNSVKREIGKAGNFSDGITTDIGAKLLISTQNDKSKRRAVHTMRGRLAVMGNNYWRGDCYASAGVTLMKRRPSLPVVNSTVPSTSA